MTALVTTLNELSADWLPRLGTACWQGGLALLFVFALCRAMPRMPAPAQCWLWRLAFVKLFVASLWIVPVQLAWLPSVKTTPTEQSATGGVDSPYSTIQTRLTEFQIFIHCIHSQSGEIRLGAGNEQHRKGKEHPWGYREKTSGVGSRSSKCG